MNGATNVVREKRPFTGLVELTGVSLKDAVAWFGQQGTGLSGRLFLTFRGTGNAEVSSINGGGNLRVEEAELPSFPAIGKVQALLGGIVPAFGIPRRWNRVRSLHPRVGRARHERSHGAQ